MVNMDKGIRETSEDFSHSSCNVLHEQSNYHVTMIELISQGAIQGEC